MFCYELHEKNAKAMPEYRHNHEKPSKSRLLIICRLV